MTEDKVLIKPVVMIDIDLLDNADYNPQEQNKVVFNALVKKIKKEGYAGTVKVAPSPLNAGRYTIISGNHSTDALRLLGAEQVPCNVFDDWDEDKQKAENVSWNIVRGKFNPEKLAKLYDDMSKKYGDELAQKMMSLEVDNSIIKQIMKQVRREMPPELQKKLDDSKDEIKTVDQLSAILNEMFAKYGDDLQHGFMVFEYGGKTHFWIRMNKKLKEKMRRFADECRETKGQLSERIYVALDCGEKQSKVVENSRKQSN